MRIIVNIIIMDKIRKKRVYQFFLYALANYDIGKFPILYKKNVLVLANIKFNLYGLEYRMNFRSLTYSKNPFSLQIGKDLKPLIFDIQILNSALFCT